MFISVKRHERELQQLMASSNRLTEAVLKSSELGLFLLDAKHRIQPQMSRAMTQLFRREDFTNLSLEKLFAPLVSAKTLSAVRAWLARLLEGTQNDAPCADPLQDLEVRLPNQDGSFDSAHYAVAFTAIDQDTQPRAWLVRVSDITARIQQQREIEDLQAHHQLQGEILRSVLQAGGARFGAFLQRTDAGMKTINGVLKKPAREADAFRHKLEETLEEVDRIRRDAAALKLTGLAAAARLFEDALQELRSRGTLSGGDFLPLAVKLDQLYGQFAQLRACTTQAGASRAPVPDGVDALLTDNGTQIIEAPGLLPQLMAAAGSLHSTLSTLTELVAQENDKQVVLECTGLEWVPARYQSTIKNVAIQLIRNAVMHGIENTAVRAAAGKPPHGTLLLDFKAMPDGGYELLFQDDGQGLDPDVVRRTAVQRGVVSADAAARLRDKQAIKLIFKSGYTTMAGADADVAHGAGMSLVRRYVHESGGRIALASLLGHETRFKVTLPPTTGIAAAQVA